MLDQAALTGALPQYEIGAELGRGGWGIVLSARHRQLDRAVAIKQLPRAFAADPLVRRRFVDEARMIASLDHPHVVPVFDYIEHQGLCLLVMERLDGGTVWERFTTRGVAPDEACAIVLATCAGLESAHRRGILHRDIKPENLMFSSTGTLKVTDFGIAKMLSGSQTLVTRAGDVVGTPAYMAPEQAQNKELSPATDVYAVGTMLYELLAGRLPFDADVDALQILYAHAFEPPKPLRAVAPTLPAGLAEVTMRALATAPEDRYPTAEALGVAVAEAATDAWGTGWLTTTLPPVMANGPIVAATEGLGTRSSPRPLHVSGASSAAPTPPAPAPPTEVVGFNGVVGTDAAVPAPDVVAVANVGPAPRTEAVGSPVPRAPTTLVAVRPVTALRPRQPGFDDLSAGDLIPLDQIVERPAPPVRQTMMAVILLVLAVVFAFVGPGFAAHPQSLARASVALDGADIGSASGVPVDLARPVTVTGTAPAGSTVDQVRVVFSVAGIRLAGATVPAIAGPSGTFTATVDDTGGRYLVPRRTAGRIDLLSTGTIVATGQFRAVAGQSSFLTVPGGVAVALVLFVFAYAESLLRSLRRGRKRFVGPVGMALLGAVFGVAATIVSWLAVGSEPRIASMMPPAVLGAAGGLFCALAARRTSLRRRWRPWSIDDDAPMRSGGGPR